MIAALLTAADPSDLRRQAEQATREGNCHAVKLKVGGRAIADDLRRVETVAALLGDRTALRLDANQAWSLPEAFAFWHGLKQRGIAPEFVEEPTGDSGASKELSARGMPVAFDESLRRFTPQTFPHWDCATAVVLKPTILGGYDATVEWIAEADARGVSPVVSGCFESGVGHRMVALAAALTQAPAGLGTYRSLADDVLKTRLPLDGTAAHLHLFLTAEVDVGRLTRIA